MKRKTNLFYTSGPDSKFITFSNYTESLTGNFLSTDTKIYPSKFLCLNIDNLNDDSKELLIKYLVAYYENKLAFLRDKLIEEDKQVEDYLMPFNYLLEALCRVKIEKRQENDLDVNFINIIKLLRKINIEDDNFADIDKAILLQSYLKTYDNRIDGIKYKVKFNRYPQENDQTLNALSLMFIYTDEVPNSNHITHEVSIIDFFGTEDSQIFIKSYANSVLFEIDEETKDLIENIISALGLEAKTNQENETTGYFSFSTDLSQIKDEDTDWIISSKYIYNNKYKLSIKDYDQITENDIDIAYIGDITESDYNGTYTDTICNIDLFNYNKGKINIDLKNIKEDNNIDNYTYTIENTESNYNILYNWQQGTPVEYEGLMPIPDENGSVYRLIYYTKSIVNSINIINPNVVTDDNTEIIDELKFNIIIPLFDVTNINYKMSPNDIIESNIIDLSSINDENILYCHNVPLGMWISNEPIVLQRDQETGYSQSWSLLISSQFKPFPYSTKEVKEYDISKIGNSFSTFSQILNKQNDIINKFEYFNNKIIEIEDKINAITTKINNGTIINSAFDSIEHKNNKFKNSLILEFEEFKDYIVSYIKNLTWTSSI